jgi:hypothetical protein
LLLSFGDEKERRGKKLPVKSVIAFLFFFLKKKKHKKGGEKLHNRRFCPL